MGKTTKTNTNHSSKTSNKPLHSTAALDTLNLTIPRAKLLSMCLLRMNEEVSNPLSQYEVCILADLIDEALAEATEALHDMNGRRDDA